MKNISKAFKRAIFEDERNYLAYADITLQDGTELALTNSEIWTGGFSCESAVGDDNEFTAVGSVIIGSAELIINNIYETYSDYDFTNAKVKMSIGMEFTEDEQTRLEKIKLGVYTVDETNYNGATIKLSMLDNLEKFDRPYVTNLTYPATLDEIVRDACTKCGVSLSTYDFPHKTYEVASAPEGDNTTFREVLSYAATIAGCFVKCDEDGKLELKWFDQTSLENYAAELDGGTFNPWSGGTVYDGGTFNPWTSGDVYDGGTLQEERNIHYIFSLRSQNIEIDDVVITGVTFSLQDEVDGETQTFTYTSGTAGYVIEIEENPFITRDTAQTVVDWLGTQLIGLRFRKLNVTHGSDPSIEAGDVAIVIDRKQNVYRTLVTRVTFSVDSTQTIISGASTPSRNSATRFSSQTKSYVEARKLVEKEKTSREAALEDLAEALASSSGLYTDIVTTQSGDIFYLHDKRDLIDSKIVWKMTAEAWGVTDDWQGTDESTTQADKWVAGMTVNGDVIARIMDVIGLNFDWGTGGTLTLGGRDNINGVLRILDASGNQIGSWNKDGFSMTQGSMNIGSGNFVVTAGGNVTAKNLTATNAGQIANFTIKSDSLRYNNGGVAGEYYTATNDKVYIGELGVIDRTGRTGDETERTVSLHDGRLVFGTLNIPGVIIQNIVSSSTQWYKDFEIISQYSASSQTVVMQYTHQGYYNTQFPGSVQIQNLSVPGTKSRLATTKDYGERLLYCYETPSPLFGDIGEGTISEDGCCYIPLDPIFAETITTNQYQVFLQKYGDGDCYVAERHSTYFVVCGTAGLSFAWEIKAKQAGFDQKRLDQTIAVDAINESPDFGAEAINMLNLIDYGTEAINHIEDIANEREVV